MALIIGIYGKSTIPGYNLESFQQYMHTPYECYTVFCLKGLRFVCTREPYSGHTVCWTVLIYWVNVSQRCQHTSENTACAGILGRKFLLPNCVTSLCLRDHIHVYYFVLQNMCEHFRACVVFKLLFVKCILMSLRYKKNESTKIRYIR